MQFKSLNGGSGLLIKAMGLFLITSFVFFLSCRSSKNAADTNLPVNKFSVPKVSINANAPFLASEKPADQALCKAIGDEIDNRQVQSENWGILVVSLRDGRAACLRNSGHLFLPASIQKLITAAVSLDKLGPDFRFKTSIYGGVADKTGALQGDLVFYGRGAPDLGEESMSELVAQLRKKGINKISGNIIGDESYFKGDGLGDGWTWNAAQWYYGAAASALSFERNQITVTIRDGKPSSESEFVELSGELQPVESIEAVGIKRKLGTNEVFVWGNGKNLKARIAVSDPALFAARVLKEKLEKSGITVEGRARVANWKSPTDVSDLKELASIESSPLSEIVREMNRNSVNLHAELLLRTLGKNFGGEAPDSDPKMNLLRGDDLAGTSVIKKWITENGLAGNEIAIHDGSGLSRLDRVTPELVVRVLLFVAQRQYSQAFTDSLPVSGESGTLKGRLGSLKGRIAAKTGSITYVNSLAGYAVTSDETFAFAIICNDETTRNDSGITIDNIATLIAEFGGSR